MLFFTYGQYVDPWDELSNIFSREAVRRGSFDKFAESTKLKRGTAEVDTAFLQEIESWRESLARNFALRNDIGPRDLNFAVQRTIDRLIFPRMCEDRGIENYGQLMTLLNGEAAYSIAETQFPTRRFVGCSEIDIRRVPHEAAHLIMGYPATSTRVCQNGRRTATIGARKALPLPLRRPAEARYN